MTMNMTDEQLALLIDQIPGAQLLPTLRAAIYLDAAKALNAYAKTDEPLQIHTQGLYAAADHLVFLSRGTTWKAAPAEPTRVLDAGRSAIDLTTAIMYAVDADDRRHLEFVESKITVDARDQNRIVIDPRSIPGAEQWSIPRGSGRGRERIETDVARAAVAIADLAWVVKL